MTATSALTRDCRSGYHRKCIMADSCGCTCHRAKAPAGNANGGASVFEVGGRVEPKVELIWGDLPRAGRPGRDLDATYGPLIAELKRRPGEWARLVLYASKTGAGGALTALRKRWPDCEFASRKLPDGSAVFGRAREEES